MREPNSVRPNESKSATLAWSFAIEIDRSPPNNIVHPASRSNGDSLTALSAHQAWREGRILVSKQTSRRVEDALSTMHAHRSLTPVVVARNPPNLLAA